MIWAFCLICNLVFVFIVILVDVWLICCCLDDVYCMVDVIPNVLCVSMPDSLRDMLALLGFIDWCTV